INNAINAVYNGIKPLSINAKRLEALVNPVMAVPESPCSDETKQEIHKASERIFSLASVIENGAARTTRIIGDLKTFSHPGNEEFNEFDLHESLDICLNLLFSQVKHR